MKAACAWCLRIINMPETYDVKGRRDAVCSKECAEQESKFRLFYADILIGLRNQEQFGINPNHRGRHGKKKDT